MSQVTFSEIVESMGVQWSFKMAHSRNRKSIFSTQEFTVDNLLRGGKDEVPPPPPLLDNDLPEDLQEDLPENLPLPEDDEDLNQDDIRLDREYKNEMNNTMYYVLRRKSGTLFVSFFWVNYYFIFFYLHLPNLYSK